MYYLLFIALLALPQDQKQPPKQDPPKKVVVDPDAPRTLKDEEAGADVKEYYLDPDQAKKEIEIGNYYMRKSSYTAAAKRFEEATKWQPNNAVAYTRLGLALE